MTSWLLPTAKVGIRTEPPPSRVSFAICWRCTSASFLEGCISLAPPYVASITTASILGKLFTAGSKSRVFSYLKSPVKAILYNPSPTWKCAIAEPRICPALWNVSFISGPISVTTPKSSVIVCFSASRIIDDSYGIFLPSRAATSR